MTKPRVLFLKRFLDQLLPAGFKLQIVYLHPDLNKQVTFKNQHYPF